MKHLSFFLFFLLVACGTETEGENFSKKIESPEDLIVRKGNRFTEFYPGKKKVKMEGNFDDAEQRHGIWKYYTEAGITISIAEYNHGKKNGISMVYFANGSLNYEGQYDNDKAVGVWKMYDEKTGKLTSETNHDSE